MSTRRFWPTCLDSILPVDESEYCTFMTWIDALLMLNVVVLWLVIGLVGFTDGVAGKV